MTNNDGYKACSVCKLENPLSNFSKKLNGKSSRCKDCDRIYNDNYRSAHKDDLYEYRRKYYRLHKDELITYGLEYRADSENKKSISKNKKEYLENNRAAIYEQKNKRRKIRRDTDPFYRLRNLVSRSVAFMLKKKGSSKKGGSIRNHLPYSVQDLKDHLESQFESWMSWDNQNKYNPDIWDDTDPTTWTWNIDHIIPQADLPYSSMEEDNFKKCWALENLRPLSAKQNLLDGINRIRHLNG